MALVPLTLMPDWVQEISRFLPFQWAFFFPIEALVGDLSNEELARGLLAAAGSTLVLLDEPTANLDPQTEAAVLDNLFAALGDACLVSSVHRLNLLDRFDEVLVMHDGRLVAQGRAAVLAAVSPDFRRLVSAQRRASEEAALHS